MMSATKSLAAAVTAALLLSSASLASAGDLVTVSAPFKDAAESSIKAVMATPTASGVKAAITKGNSLAAEFIHKIYEPAKPNGETVVLLHGSGGNETSLVELAKKVAPHATLLGVRGRIVQEGIQRWYKRVSPVRFDQTDIKKQADAFAEFFGDMVKTYDIDLSKTTFLGYSNGANLIGALTLLHPGVVRKAVLLRAMPVLEEAPTADLSKARFLTVAGEDDTLYSPFAPKLEKLLRGYGANVEARRIHSGHLLGDEDVKVVAEWLGAEPMLAAGK